MSIAKRLAISAILTAILIAAASEGMFVTSSPRLVSLLIEPFSLLLMPGLVVAVILAGPHDFTPNSVLGIAAIFYLAFFYWALSYWTGSALFPRRASRRSTSR